MALPVAAAATGANPLLGLGVGVGGGLLNLLFGSDDRFEDMQRPLTEKEKQALLAKIFGDIDEQFASAEGGAISGLERRGLGSPGQTAGIISRLKGGKAKARGQATSDVNLATRGQTFIPGQDLPGLEGIGMNLSRLLNPPEQPQDNFASILELLQN